MTERDHHFMEVKYEKIVIISGGSIDDAFAIDWIKQYQPEYIIVADSGMEFVRRAGIVSHMIIGDFDSVASETVNSEIKVEGSLGSLYTPSISVKNASFSAPNAFAIAQAASSALIL